MELEVCIGNDGDAVEKAEADIGAARAEIKHAEAELERGEADLARAEAELREAEERKPRLVEVIVDRKPKLVPPGRYIVAAFKELVGVAADRELDILKDGALHPLKDDGEITIHGHEVFVSHVRGGGSS